MASVRPPTDPPPAEPPPVRSAGPAGNPDGTAREASASTQTAPGTSSPPFVGPFTSMARYPWVVVACVVAVMLPALVLAARAPVTYTAEARVIVGRIDVQSQSVPGVVAASNQLAGTYARLVNTSAVVDAVAQATGVEADGLSARISASPIAETPIIRIQTTAPSEDEAVTLGAAATEALIDYVGSINDTSGDAAQLLDEYRTAVQEVNAAEVARDAIGAQLQATADPAAAANLRADFLAAQATADSAQLRADTLADLYRASQQSRQDPEIVRVVGAAAPAGNDQRATLQLAFVASLLAGLVIGAGVATLVANRAARRAPVS